MRFSKMAGLVFVLALVGCGVGSDSGGAPEMGKVTSLPATIEGHLEWRLGEMGSGTDSEVSESDSESESADESYGPDIAVGFIKAGEKIYSIEADPALLSSAGIADKGEEGVEVRATLGARSQNPVSEGDDTYVITAVSRL